MEVEYGVVESSTHGYRTKTAGNPGGLFSGRGWGRSGFRGGRDPGWAWTPNSRTGLLLAYASPHHKDVGEGTRQIDRRVEPCATWTSLCKAIVEQGLREVVYHKCFTCWELDNMWGDGAQPDLPVDTAPRSPTLEQVSLR